MQEVKSKPPRESLHKYTTTRQKDHFIHRMSARWISLLGNTSNQLEAGYSTLARVGTSAGAIGSYTISSKKTIPPLHLPIMESPSER